MNDVVLRELASRIVTDWFSAISRRKIAVTSLLSLFLQRTFYFTIRRCLAPVFLQLIPAREGNIFQHNETTRTETTSLISQESLDAQIVHDFRFPATLSIVHVGWQLGRRSSSSVLRSVYIVADWHSWLHFSHLISIIINILLRDVYHTRRRTVRTALTSTDGPHGYRHAGFIIRLETILTFNFPRERRYTYSHFGAGPLRYVRGATKGWLPWTQFKGHLR